MPYKLAVVDLSFSEVRFFKNVDVDSNIIPAPRNF